MSDAITLWLLLGALALDAVIGDPPWLWRRVPHPVVLCGHAIDALDRRLNRETDDPVRRRTLGVLTVAVLLACAAAIGLGLTALFAAIPYGWLGEIVVVATLLSQRSLHEHVAAVARGLEQGGLAGGRQAVAQIVGRDPASLDEPGVCRAAIESLAENFSDGVVAPALWYAVAGLPGILAYKALNTADSMLGHKDPRHAEFGWASARLDDLANLPASRLSAVLVGIGAFAMRGPAAGRRAAVAVASDARHHRSPNAGWPEAAMAGALDVALAGPRSYAGVVVEDAWMHGAGWRTLAAGDVRTALRIHAAACLALAGLILAGAWTIG